MMATGYKKPEGHSFLITSQDLEDIKNKTYAIGYRNGSEQAKGLRAMLKALLDHLSDEDEEGLLEHVEIIADARALLAKAGGE